MRNLSLTAPRMTGTDVVDWQSFLQTRHLFDGGISGVFDPATSKGTKDYQTSGGLKADGVVGAGTFARAIRDGFQSSTKTLELGMDASVNCSPLAACIVATGMKFVARYYSKAASKAITRKEGLALSKAGLKLLVVYQDKQDDVRFFTGGEGKASARRALTQAQALGQPAGSAIYFAVDFDPAADDVRGPVSDYFLAVNQEFRAAAVQYAIGVYGSGLTCRLVLDASLAQFAWLSQSTGFRESAAFRSRAHLIQIAPSRDICEGKLSIDDDVAQVKEYGAFRLI